MTRHSPGEGSITQRKDGRWQASLQIDGRRRTVYGKTRQEASAKLRALKRNGPLARPSTLTLDDLFIHWLEAVSPTLKPRTIADYQQTYALYIRPALGAARLSKLNPERLQALYGELQGRGLVRAAAKAHAVLHRAFRLAVLWALLDENPCERVVKPTYRPVRRELWTPWELAAFLSSAKEHWLYPLFVTAIGSGCRVGELCALTWADVDLDAGTLHVNKTLHRIRGQWVITPPKTQAGARVIRLPQEGIAALRQQAELQAAWRGQAGPLWQETGLVFSKRNGTPLLEQNVSHALTGLCRRLGIREVTPHGLRHLSASLLLSAGLPVPVVSQRLGHATPAITMAVYAHALGGADKGAAETLGRVVRRAIGAGP